LTRSGSASDNGGRHSKSGGCSASFSLARSFGVTLAIGLVAAGASLDGRGGALTDGWRVQPSPNPSPERDHLNGLAAISSTKAWAVGYYRKGRAVQTLIEHRNG
jgi:hypothetical protein